MEDYVEAAWLPAYRRHDPRDLLAMLEVWLANDVASAAGCCSADSEADLAQALGRIEAATTVVAGRHDLYFTPADCAAEARLIPAAVYAELDSDLGHRAGNPRQDPEAQQQLRTLLEALWRR